MALSNPLVYPLGGDYPAPAKVLWDTQRGKDVSMVRNPATGKFDIQWDLLNNPVFTDEETHAVLSLIYEHKGEYWADATGNRGSYLHTLKELRKATPSKAKAFVEDSLQPLLDARRISLPSSTSVPFVDAKRNALNANRLDITVNYTTPDGKDVTLRQSLGY